MKKNKPTRYRGNRCFMCGRECTKHCIDNTGQPYMGCPVCRFIKPEELPKDRTIEELSEQNASLLGEISRLEAQLSAEREARADAERVIAWKDGRIAELTRVVGQSKEEGDG